MASTTSSGQICVAAILKGEEPFLDEWIAYHRIIGVAHFYLYDNAPTLPLRLLLRRHAAYVTVIDWPGEYEELPGRNKQTKAYVDALRHITHEWVAFIDGDEFIVLRHHANLHDFLEQFTDVGAVRLTWHLFGHNGYENDPTGLITAALTRRRSAPGRLTKSITRVEAIAAIESAHRCNLQTGYAMVDANKRPHSSDPYAGKTDAAHINHYMCRSFRDWMKRIDRGEAAFTKANYPKDKDHLWRFDPELCRRKFFAIANETNELVDEYMLKYSGAIHAFLRDLERPR